MDNWLLIVSFCFAIFYGEVWPGRRSTIDSWNQSWLLFWSSMFQRRRTATPKRTPSRAVCRRAASGVRGVGAPRRPTPRRQRRRQPFRRLPPPDRTRRTAAASAARARPRRVPATTTRPARRTNTRGPPRSVFLVHNNHEGETISKFEELWESSGEGCLQKRSHSSFES